MSTTIKDIAKKLNISVSTVSYALNGGPRSVPDDVRQRVVTTARELNYRPNRMARAMITGRSHTIGIVPPQVGNDVFLGPHLQLAMNGIANEAWRLHQDLLLFTRCEVSAYEEMLSIVLDGRVDGVIFIAPQFNHQAVELATSLHLPCAALSGVPLGGVTSYSVDNDKGIRMALEHLASLGHRKIAHVTGRLDMQDSVSRLQGYLGFIKDHRLEYRDEWVVNGQFLIEGGRNAFRTLMALDDRPTAIMCANDEMAIGALLEAHTMGVKVPDDVSIVGFDMTEGSGNVFPPLTTVRQPIIEMGAAAVRAVVGVITGKDRDPDQVFSPELIVRASTSHPTKEPS